MILLPAFSLSITADAATFSRNLVFGMSGEDVRELQVILNSNPDTKIISAGVGSPGNESTYFGQLTLVAVKKFQTIHAADVLYPVGLYSPTGLVGALTRKKLQELSQGASARILSLGYSGEDVRALQRALNAKGYVVALSGAGSPGNETSFFGGATDAALKRYQCEKLLVCSGTPASNGYGSFDAKTRALIFGQATSSSVATTRIGFASASSGGSSGGSSGHSSGGSSGSSGGGGSQTPVPTAPLQVQTGILIDDFDSGAGSWGFYDGREFPGASGGFSVGQGKSGSGGKISFSIGGSGHYVLAERAVTATTTASTLSLSIKAPAGLDISLRLVDSSGQTLVYSLPRSLESLSGQNSWIRYTVKLPSPSYYWGGAADGVPRFPISTVQVGVEPLRYMLDGAPHRAVSSGSVEFDDVVFDAPEPVIDPVSSAVLSVPRSDLRSTFGASIHGNDFNEPEYGLLQGLGVKLVRTDLLWSEVEHEEGVYDFSVFDPVVDALNGRGMRVLFVLAYGNALYGIPGYSGITTTEQIDQFGAFAGAAAAHYSNKDVAFEIWNEPNLNNTWLPHNDPTSYATFAKTVTQKIREANPGVQIVTGGISGFDFDWLADMLDAGGAQGANAIGVHPYLSESPEHIVGQLVELRNLVAEKLGSSVPLWNTEWGYSSDWFGQGASSQGERVQAKLALRQVLTSFIAGFPSNPYYDLTNDSLDASESNMNFGLYTRSGREKQAGQALRILNETVNGWSTTGLIPTYRGDLHVLKLESGGSVQVIAWTETSSPVSNASPVTLKFSRHPTSIKDMLGMSLGYTEEAGAYVVQVTDEPMYIRF